MLYLVSTPIGNLSDISLRALEILQQSDVIVSEDTRKTGLLLNHFDIRKPQISFFEGNESRQLPRIISLLRENKSVALVSSAGTPVISDPGYTLVRAALSHQIEITAIPGPTAFSAALILSGLPVHSFTFRGFPPRKPGPRLRFLKSDLDSPHTLIYYESPHRLLAFLQDALQIFGDRPAAIANDLTKKFEHIERGSLSDLLNFFSDQKLLGEYTIVIAGSSNEK